ncbi:metallophosphoesterase family protein [Balneola sp. MJW-20]|uniref:metallophosphoesterase family protein n=1 Tax=Gracilimonas aurantiaca TaxID=3234185 RepID=UPI003466B55B
MSNKIRYIAIGDVHGCINSLISLIDSLRGEITDSTYLVFLGDYVDRGPESKSVIDYLLKLRDEFQCIFIRGNHDQMLLDAFDNDQWALWLQNGGAETLESYGLDIGEKDFPQEHLDFLRQTRLYWDTPEFLFVHGGIDPDKTVSEVLETVQDKRSFMWERSHINQEYNEWEKTVVFGHTPVKSPLIKDKMIGMDTGCVYPSMGYGNLSAMILPEMDLHQQECTDL